MSGQTFNLTDQTNLFKINYYKKSENVYNSYNVLHGRIKKKHDFVGKQKFVAVPMGFAGGFGTGNLPTARSAKYEGAIITAKKVYAVCEIDRESIKASKGDKGAFVEATKESVKKTIETYMRHSSRILFKDGSGELGRGYAGGAAVTGDGSTNTPYIIELDHDLWNEAMFEEDDGVNINGESTYLYIDEVDPDNYKIKLVGTSSRLATLVTGTAAFGASDVVYVQKSKDNDPQGLEGIRDAVVGSTSLYGITCQRRWKMVVEDASGAGINPDRMNGVMLDVEKKCGKVPNLIITSYTQLRKILDFMEDQKVYNLPARNVKGNLSYSGVEFMSTRGAVGIFTDRFCHAADMWFLNDNYIEVHHRPGFGWFDDDGTVFLRLSGSDEYGARYGGYYENYIVPPFHGAIKNLST